MQRSPASTFPLSGSTTPVPLDADVAAALSADPDYIIAACGPADAATIKKEIDRSGKPTKLFLTDAAETPALVSSLGAEADGIEGTSPTADPSSGFTAAYQEKFGEAPTDYAAPTYDALLLAAYTSARQDAAPFESLPGSIRHVVAGNGTRESWDAQGSRDAISAIMKGQSPYITGASGPLDFDPVYGVDPLVTYYSHWTVENGSFRTVEVFSSAKAGTSKVSGESADLSQASGSLMENVSPGGATYIPPMNRTDFEAIVVGPSSGWNNYRHESDALAVYTLLRENGVPDDHIILMLYDDVPDSPENPLYGNVHNVPGGANLRANAEVDYSGPNVTPDTFMDVLTGNITPETPFVLSSNASTDVFVYIASHGSPGSIVFPYPPDRRSPPGSLRTSRTRCTGKENTGRWSFSSIPALGRASRRMPRQKESCTLPEPTARNRPSGQCTTRRSTSGSRMSSPKMSSPQSGRTRILRSVTSTRRPMRE